MTWLIGGGWFNGKQHGHGKYIWKNGDVYTGAWVSGKRHGEGRMEWSNGNIHTGSWENDKRAGRGRIEWHDGSELDGDIYEGMSDFLESNFRCLMNRIVFSIQRWLAL